MAAPVMTQTKPEARVLVVDDETNIVELLSVSLKFQGFEVYTAGNGPAALDRAREVVPSEPQLRAQHECVETARLDRQGVVAIDHRRIARPRP